MPVTNDDSRSGSKPSRNGQFDDKDPNIDGASPREFASRPGVAPDLILGGLAGPERQRIPLLPASAATVWYLKKPRWAGRLFRFPARQGIAFSMRKNWPGSDRVRLIGTEREARWQGGARDYFGTEDLLRCCLRCDSSWGVDYRVALYAPCEKNSKPKYQKCLHCRFTLIEHKFGVATQRWDRLLAVATLPGTA